jgi:hypothetical protein
MIRYTVVWREDIQNDLAGLWLDTPNRQQITAAADRIDAELLIDAHVKGEDLGEGVKSLTCPPLIVHFRIDEGDRKVFVEAIDLLEGWNL